MVINGISRVNTLITGVITHLLSGMSHQISQIVDGSRSNRRNLAPWAGPSGSKASYCDVFFKSALNG